MIVTYYRLGKSPINFDANEGITVAGLFKKEGITVEDNHIISVNSETVNIRKVLQDGDKVVVTKNEIKGGD